jgi:hypothetical protein
VDSPNFTIASSFPRVAIADWCRSKNLRCICLRPRPLREAMRRAQARVGEMPGAGGCHGCMACASGRPARRSTGLFQSGDRDGIMLRLVLRLPRARGSDDEHARSARFQGGSSDNRAADYGGDIVANGARLRPGGGEGQGRQRAGGLRTAGDHAMHPSASTNAARRPLRSA